MSRACRILIILAAIMGADGIMLAAASAHGADASRLVSASSMLLFHAAAVLGAPVVPPPQYLRSAPRDAASVFTGAKIGQR